MLNDLLVEVTLSCLLHGLGGAQGAAQWNSTGQQLQMGPHVWGLMPSGHLEVFNNFILEFFCE